TARAEGAPITELIINRVEVLHGSCKYCRARHASQRPHLARLKAEFQDLRQRRVPLLSSEVRGMDGLLAFGRMVWIASNPDHPASLRSLPSSRGGEPSSLIPLLVRRGASEATRGGQGLSHPGFLIVGGKGGVGKTTTAAALALRLADEH